MKSVVGKDLTLIVEDSRDYLLFLNSDKNSNKIVTRDLMLAPGTYYVIMTGHYAPSVQYKIMVSTKGSQAIKQGLDGIKVIINGIEQSYSQNPILKSGTTLVPLRGIFESLGATVSYNSKQKEITSRKGNIKLNLTLGDKFAIVNNKKISLSQPAQTINGSTMVPLRFIGEALGANVQWDGNTKTITITSKE